MLTLSRTFELSNGDILNFLVYTNHTINERAVF